MQGNHGHFDVGAVGRIENTRIALRRTMAPITLRYMLHMLISGKLANEERPAYIYEALAAAGNAGYACGIRAYDDAGGDVELYAVIDLPTGSISFALGEYVGSTFVFEPELVRGIAEAYIGDEGY